MDSSILSQPKHISRHGQTYTWGEEMTTAESPHDEEGKQDKPWAMMVTAKRWQVHGLPPQSIPTLSLIPFPPHFSIFDTLFYQPSPESLPIEQVIYFIGPFLKNPPLTNELNQSPISLPSSHLLPKNYSLYLRFISIPPLSGSFLAYVFSFSTKASSEQTLIS